MGERTVPRPVWTDADTDALFATIGRYVILFQWIEGVLDQILLLAWGHENWTQSQARLAKMRNFDKTAAVRDVVFNSPDFARVHARPEWCSEFDALIQRLNDERGRRNGLVHSQYLFEFVEIGGPPMRSDRKRAEGETVFVREDLTKDAQEALLKNLAQLAMDVGFAHVQLVHDYKAGVSPTSPIA